MPKNKPSMTARKVASDFLFKVEEPEVAALAPAGSIEATYDLLEISGMLKPWMIRLLKAPWYQRFGNALEKPILSGQMLHLVLRKRFLDDEVREAISAGAEQVLVIGGGFDTLSLRLAAEYPSVSFLEVDHPPTHRVKASAVREMGAASPNLHLEGVDLSQRSLADLLRETPHWSTDARSAVVAEGVLMYLNEADVVAFLDAVRRCSGPGSRVFFSYVFEGALTRKNLGWLGGALTLFLKLSGEPFRWGVSAAGIEPFLDGQGWRILGDPGRFDLKETYLVGAGLETRDVARLERVAAAEVAPDGAG